MRPTSMVLAKRGTMAQAVFENQKASVSIELPPIQLVRWAHEIIERFEPEIKDYLR